MPEFYAEWSRMIEISADMSASAGRLQMVIENTDSVKNGLAINDASREQIILSLNKCKERVERLYSGINKCAVVLEDAAEKYKQTENILCFSTGDLTPEEISDLLDFIPDSGFIDPQSLDRIIELLYPLVGGVLSGNVVSALKGLIGTLSGNDYGDFSGSIGNGASILSTVLDIVTANGVGSAAAGWAERFTENFADDLGDFVSGGGKTVCKWAGVVLSLISNGIDNYNEFSGDPSAYNIYRGVAETFTETGVDLLLSVAAGAAIGACVAAPPAAAVAIVSAIVVYGVNKGSEALFGRSLTEIISDTILDGFEERSMLFLDQVSNIGEFGAREGAITGDFINNTINTFSDGLQLSDIGEMADNTLDFVSDTGQAIWDLGVDTVSNVGKHAVAFWDKITSH